MVLYIPAVKGGPSKLKIISLLKKNGLAVIIYTKSAEVLKRLKDLSSDDLHV